MKVLFGHSLPFSLAHGGMQTLIESVMRELADLGVEVEPSKWWDPQQGGDVIHFFQRPDPGVARYFRQAGYRVVMTEIIDTFASMPRSRLTAHRAAAGVLQHAVSSLRDTRALYQTSDAVVYLNRHEMETAILAFGLPPDKAHVIPLGLEPDAMADLARPCAPDDHLVSLGTICARKNSVFLAQAARAAGVPVLFVGKPISERDPYYEAFLALVDGRSVRFAGYVAEAEKRQLLRSARGFVLLSSGESGCIAVHEAAAAGLPLLLPDRRWATRGYPPSERIVFTRMREGELAKHLANLHARGQRADTPTFPVRDWREVAGQYRDLYHQVLASDPAR